MHRLTVHYGVPSDPETFDQRYVDEHVPMVTPLEAVTSFTWTKVRPLGGEADLYMVAQLDFEDGASMKAALASPEMGEAAEPPRRSARRCGCTPARSSRPDPSV